MGIVNITPDSFSDGGRFLDPNRAIARGTELADEGADVIDIGGGFLRVDTNAFHSGIQSIEVENAIVLMDYFRQ